jgi:hypothetical protein
VRTYWEEEKELKALVDMFRNFKLTGKVRPTVQKE